MLWLPETSWTAPFFSSCSRKSLAALILMPNFVATAYGVKTFIFLISATFFSFLFLGFSFSSLACWRSICFKPSFFFPPIFTCFLQLLVRELEGLAYFNLMLALPLFKRHAKLLLNF